MIAMPICLDFLGCGVIYYYFGSKFLYSYDDLIFLRYQPPIPADQVKPLTNFDYGGGKMLDQTLFVFPVANYFFFHS